MLALLVVPSTVLASTMHGLWKTLFCGFVACPCCYYCWSSVLNAPWKPLKISGKNFWKPLNSVSVLCGPCVCVLYPKKNMCCMFLSLLVRHMAKLKEELCRSCWRLWMVWSNGPMLLWWQPPTDQTQLMELCVALVNETSGHGFVCVSEIQVCCSLKLNITVP